MKILSKVDTCVQLCTNFPSQEEEKGRIRAIKLSSPVWNIYNPLIRTISYLSCIQLHTLFCGLGVSHVQAKDPLKLRVTFRYKHKAHRTEQSGVEHFIHYKNGQFCLFAKSNGPSFPLVLEEAESILET